MDIVNLFIRKNIPTKDIKYKSVKELFESDENKSKLAHVIYREIYLPNNQTLYNEIRKKVDKYVNLWIQNGKLDRLTETNSYSINAPDEQLNFYNKLFIDTFKNLIINFDTYQSEIDNNPYKHIIEYKIKVNNNLSKETEYKKKNISEILAQDYDFITFNNYNDKYTLNTNFTPNYHKIPYYEKALYKRNYDMLDMGSFRERKLLNDNYKRYNNDELMNNVNYLRKK